MNPRNSMHENRMHLLAIFKWDDNSSLKFVPIFFFKVYDFSLCSRHLQENVTPKKLQ